MKFDYSLNIQKVPFRVRLENQLAKMIMPYLGYLFMSDRMNTCIWRVLGVQVGARSRIRRGTKINSPSRLIIGKDSLIHGELRTRGGLEIGDHVELVGNVQVSTQRHNLYSSIFENVYEPINIKDESWVSLNAIILSGVTLEEGTVVAAGAVVNKNTEQWGVYAGVPAKKISEREPIDRLQVDKMRLQAKDK